MRLDRAWKVASAAPPNSAAAPDRVPFGGPAPAAPRFSATRCVALWEPKARGRVSGRTLCRPEVHSEERSDEESGATSHERTISAHGASSGELAAVDDARAA